MFAEVCIRKFGRGFDSRRLHQFCGTQFRGRYGFDRQLKANGEPSMNADVKRWFKTIVANDDNYFGDYALAA